MLRVRKVKARAAGLSKLATGIAAFIATAASGATGWSTSGTAAGGAATRTAAKLGWRETARPFSVPAGTQDAAESSNANPAAGWRVWEIQLGLLRLFSIFGFAFRKVAGRAQTVP